MQPVSVGSPVSEIDTPALVLDMDAAEFNLAAMQQYCNERSLKLRPHFKLHKCSALARMQVQHGAVGMCVQKVSEAEVLVNTEACTDVFVSNEVLRPSKLDRLIVLAAKKETNITICADSVFGVERLAEAIARFDGDKAHLKIGVFVEVNVGQERCGAPPGSNEAVEIARAVAAEQGSGLWFAGVHAYNGAAQHIRTYNDRKAAIDIVVEGASSTKRAIEAIGIDVPLVTGAGTGTFSLEAGSGVYGELQPGSYLCFDKDYADNDSHPNHLNFQHALFLKTQVVSRRPERAVLDGGHKSAAIDSGSPAVWDAQARRIVPEITCGNGGDDHTVLSGGSVDPDGASFGLGSDCWIIPNHCDPTFNLHDKVVCVRGGLIDGTVDAVLDIDARGCQF